MLTLISAALANALDTGAPDEIVYLPEGEHVITPFVDGKPKKVTVRVPASKGTQIAASLQTALKKREESNVRPWFDFEHKGGMASALPKSFRYEPGKGVVAAVEWTGAGKSAIEGKDFSYFSPTFLMSQDGIPDGLPARGPLGALVNEPAFREIPRIAASDANIPNDENNAMSLLILASCGLLTQAEAALPNASELASQRVTAMNGQADKLKEIEAKIAGLEKERDDAKAEVTKMKTEAADARKERAKALIEAAQGDGRIAAKDEATAAKFRERIEAGDTFAEEMLAGLNKQNAGLDKPIIQAGAANRNAGSIDTKAQALVTAGQAKDLDEARGIIFATDATAYSEYLAGLK